MNDDSMTGSAGENKFRVKDNRRFDSDGNERGEAEPTRSKLDAPSNADKVDTLKSEVPKRALELPGVGAKSNVANIDQSFAEPAADELGQADQIDFSSFVLSLGTQALMQMGVIQPPSGVSMPIDAVAAKQTIDILSLLEVKTKGNLDQAEKKLLVEILHNLRMSYVRITTAL